jgi:hypothetical protein
VSLCLDRILFVRSLQAAGSVTQQTNARAHAHTPHTPHTYLIAAAAMLLSHLIEMIGLAVAAVA